MNLTSKRKGMVVFLIILLIVCVFFLFKIFLFKEKNIESVNLNSNSNIFALMLQQEDGTYQESSDILWPTDMIFNEVESGCVNMNGEKVENSLFIDSKNNVVVDNIEESVYCYIYFDLPPTISRLCNSGQKLNECLINNEKDINELWNSTLEEDGYRFTGTNPSNYICFGTTNKEECTSNLDKFMYRIIGVFQGADDKMYVKIIKKEALNEAYAWDSDSSKDIDWNNSELYNGINDAYFLNNSEYSYMQDSLWVSKIANWNYIMTNAKLWENYKLNGIYGVSYYYSSIKTVYLHELNKNSKSTQTCYYNSNILADCTVGDWKTLNTKISLMYLSDYLLSLGNEVIDKNGIDATDILKTSWLNIVNSNSSLPSDMEWTMSRYGNNGKKYSGLRINKTGGYGGQNDVDIEECVRPVFYLNEKELYMAGNGTLYDPIILGE